MLFTEPVLSDVEPPLCSPPPEPAIERDAQRASESKNEEIARVCVHWGGGGGSELGVKMHLLPSEWVLLNNAPVRENRN